MVLDLRLTMKIGCRDDNLFLLYTLRSLLTQKKEKFLPPFTIFRLKIYFANSIISSSHLASSILGPTTCITFPASNVPISPLFSKD